MVIIEKARTSSVVEGRTKQPLQKGHIQFNEEEFLKSRAILELYRPLWCCDEDSITVNSAFELAGWLVFLQRKLLNSPRDWAA